MGAYLLPAGSKMKLIDVITLAVVLWFQKFLRQLNAFALLAMRSMLHRDSHQQNFVEFAKQIILLVVVRVDPTFIPGLGLPRSVHKWPRLHTDFKGCAPPPLFTPLWPICCPSMPGIDVTLPARALEIGRAHV